MAPYFDQHGLLGGLVAFIYLVIVKVSSIAKGNNIVKISSSVKMLNSVRRSNSVNWSTRPCSPKQSTGAA